MSKKSKTTKNPTIVTPKTQNNNKKKGQRSGSVPKSVREEQKRLEVVVPEETVNEAVQKIIDGANIEEENLDNNNAEEIQINKEENQEEIEINKEENNLNININNDEKVENKIEEIKQPEKKEKIPFFKDDPLENKEIKKSKIIIAKTSELNGKTLYHITTDFIPKNTEIIRRYRDFDLFYKKLCQNWPCVFIPPIPPKIYFSSSTEKKVIDERIYQLENFLQVSSELNFLSETQELNLFLNHEISNSDVFQFEMKKFPAYNYKQISENYTKYFSNYKAQIKKELSEDRLSIYMGYVTDFIDKLNEYKKQIVVFGDIDKKKIYRESRVITHFTDFEQHAMSNFIEGDLSLLYFYKNQFSLEENKDKYDKLVNHPYLILSCWIRQKELELLSIKDKLNEYKDFKAKKDSYNNKLKELKQKLNDVNNGKVGFFEKIFVKGDVQKLKQKYEAELKTQTDETNYINNIVELLTDYIGVEFYKQFEKITQGFYQVIKTFASIQKENSVLALDIWLKVKNNKEEDKDKMNNILNNNEKEEKEDIDENQENKDNE